MDSRTTLTDDQVSIVAALRDFLATLKHGGELDFLFDFEQHADNPSEQEEYIAGVEREAESLLKRLDKAFYS